MGKSFHHWPTPIVAGAHEATAVMENLPPGDYGVVVIHDENENKKLDRNFIGIPERRISGSRTILMLDLSAAALHGVHRPRHLPGD